VKLLLAYAIYRIAYFVVHDVQRVHDIAVSVRFAQFLERWLVPHACWPDLACCLFNGKHQRAESWEDWKWTCQGRECRRDRRCELCWCGKFGPQEDAA